jgi:hypothetical protein
LTASFDALLDDREARIRASRDAAVAYRAIVGPPVPDALLEGALVATGDDVPEAPLLACLQAWVGAAPGAVDRRRAVRLFWLHFAGERLFADAWPGLAPVGPSDRLPGQHTVPGHWERVARAAGAPLPPGDVPLRTRWPLSMAVLLASHTGLLSQLTGTPGRIVAAPEPDGDGPAYM